MTFFLCNLFFLNNKLPMLDPSNKINIKVFDVPVPVGLFSFEELAILNIFLRNSWFWLFAFLSKSMTHIR